MAKYENIEYSLKYHYDDWSDTSTKRHQIWIRNPQDTEKIWSRGVIFENMILAMTLWLEENVSKDGIKWECSPPNPAFYFKNIEDAMGFKLKFS